MNKQMIMVSVVCLVAGLGAGGAATYFWFEANPVADPFAQREDHDEGSEHEHGGGEHGHEHQDEDGEAVRLTEEVMDEYGVKVATAGPGEVQIDLLLPGEVVVNPDEMVHVVPRVPGIARRITKSIGDNVEAGELLAVIESSELAQAKARYLASVQRLTLAQATLTSIEELKAKGIVAELEYLAAQRELAEAEIDQRAAEFKLFTLGLRREDLPTIAEDHDAMFSTYELVVPLTGTIIDRHISKGEVVTPDSAVFVLANLETVWVHLTVYQQDLALIHAGQKVVLTFGHDIPDARGVIDYVSPIVEETTRTATARVVLKNSDRVWRPGLFVHASVQVGEARVNLRVPATALQTVGGQTVVFVETEEGFLPKPVSVGRANKTHVEITSGLVPGDRYVATGAFNLKAQLMKASFSGGHSH
jgi:membrane fusion protein, heavy metal efflux system